MKVIRAGTVGQMSYEAPPTSDVRERNVLSELGRATTAYYEATPDRLEQAQQEYEEALRRFNAVSQ